MAREYTVSRSLPAPFPCRLTIHTEASGRLSRITVIPPDGTPPLEWFVYERATVWCSDKLRDAEANMETAAEVLSRIPVSIVTVLERHILAVIAEWQVEQFHQFTQAFLARRS
jgi:hypothetical protein